MVGVVGNVYVFAFFSQFFLCHAILWMLPHQINAIKYMLVHAGWFSFQFRFLTLFEGLRYFACICVRTRMCAPILNLITPLTLTISVNMYVLAEVTISQGNL